jgi:hypothetical protein
LTEILEPITPAVERFVDKAIDLLESRAQAANLDQCIHFRFVSALMRHTWACRCAGHSGRTAFELWDMEPWTGIPPLERVVLINEALTVLDHAEALAMMETKP